MKASKLNPMLRDHINKTSGGGNGNPGSILNVGFRIFSAALIAILAGCAVGPNYQRPAVDMPARFRSAASDTKDLSAAESLANLGWWQVMDDPQLQSYIAEALTNSWDIQIAAARVLQAEAAARVTRSQFMPTVGAGADWITTRASENGPTGIPAGIDPQKEYGSVYGTMATYELDLWGRIRRANEAARAQVLATRAAQQEAHERSMRPRRRPRVCGVWKGERTSVDAR